MNGTAVLYDIGKILSLGGAADYSEKKATKNAYVIDINGGRGKVSVRKTAPMLNARAMHNSVVLPSGEVVVIGGMNVPITFSDEESVFHPELWNPETETFELLAPMKVPRNYHSTAILLADGRVFAGGGGLCGNCDANHADAEILTPPYLLNANGSLRPRPTIDSAPSSTTYGSTIIVNASGAQSIDGFVLMRTAAVTHSLNTDQRRVPVSWSDSGSGRYSVRIPTNRSVLVPGNYFLFALDSAGTPSVAKLINVQ